MAAFKDIKRKVATVEKKADTRPDMVAASKFRTSQTRMESSVPMHEVYGSIEAVSPVRVSRCAPLLAAREAKRIRVVSMSSDRDLWAI